jgi:hypothetical protein
MIADELLKVILPNHVHPPAEYGSLQALGADRRSDVAFIPAQQLSYFGECHYWLHLMIGFIIAPKSTL